MSKKDFSIFLKPGLSDKKEKYNHYKPFQDPVNNNSPDTIIVSTIKKEEFITEQNDLQKKKSSNTNRTQTEHKLNTKTTFSSLVGLQRDLLIFIYNECKTARSKTTKSLSVEHVSSALKVPRGSIKTTIKRIEQKGLIERTTFKVGRGGWASYSVPDFLFQELLQYETEHKLNTNRTQTEHKLNTELNTELNTSLPVVSSYINTNYRNLDIPESWKSIDITTLEPIGFDLSHLVQIHRAYEKAPNVTLSPELIQSSIYAFAYDLKNNNIEKIFKKPPATVLLSLLKKGQPYNSITPDKCVSPIQDALNKHNQMLLLQRTQEQQMLQQIQETEFTLWRDGLSDEQLLDFCPESELAPGVPVNLRKTYRLRKAKELTKDYFDAELWPAKKQELLASATRKNIQEEVEQG